jgi:hypothetical protein
LPERAAPVSAATTARLWRRAKRSYGGEAGRPRQPVYLLSDYYNFRVRRIRNGVINTVLGGRQLPAANVLYAGVTPGSPGLYQLNILLPEDTPDGDLSLVIEIGGVASPAGAYLSVRVAP